MISVIIPVYNAEAFLERSLGSLIQQTYKDWEAICVNDGSTDSSGEILRELSSRDSRIKVLDKINEGVSQARNEGLLHVSGDYVMFLDSDDFLHPKAMELLIDITKKEKVDLVAFTYSRSYRLKTLFSHMLYLPERKKIKFPNFDINSAGYKVTDDIYRYATEGPDLDLPENEKKWIVKHCQPWRGLYKTEVVKPLKFLSGIIYEDFPWWGELLLKVKRSAILNLPLYYYYPNRKSYIFKSKQQFKIDSLKKALSASEKLYSREATEYQKQMWEKNFLIPFRTKLDKKLKRSKKG
ncbi:MAG: glycosyltransferase [Muribaculaceae bacterium]|nr:glycosyltransferase [Muribaculaceae bacterium]